MVGLMGAAGPRSGRHWWVDCIVDGIVEAALG
jgi:hypothetical protein